jgi:hypothetical protein
MSGTRQQALTPQSFVPSRTTGCAGDSQVQLAGGPATAAHLAQIARPSMLP